MLYEQWRGEALKQGIPPYGEPWKRFLSKKLDDPDYAYLRTSQSKTRFRVGYS